MLNDAKTDSAKFGSASWSTEMPKWNGYGWMRRNLNAAGYSEPEVVCFVNGSVERLGDDDLWTASELRDCEFWTERADSPNRPSSASTDGKRGNSDADWKDGLHKEPNGETAYYTRERRFVLCTTQDAVGWKPVWVFDSMRPSLVRPNGCDHEECQSDIICGHQCPGSQMQCTLPPNHEGDHIACGEHPLHNLRRWPDIRLCHEAGPPNHENKT